MFAVLSDIHANLEALQAVLADMRTHGVDEAVSLGDIEGFNGNPAECVELVRLHLAAAVRGNHEAAMFDGAVFGAPMYISMIDTTRGMLTAEQAEWLHALPLTAVHRGCRIWHATPYAPRIWGRISGTQDARAALNATAERVCLFGHTHRPAAFMMHGGAVERIPVEYDADGTFTLPLDPDARYLVNPGSVGQPRDGDRRAAYALVDDEHARITLRRVAYDVEAAAPKIARTGLPASFAEALRRGASPTGD
ncbi:MAG: metallophosphoesterase family protein [Akkermansia sp.]|nr:metallophosphoesterase family protein [Akkermansia sp.]